MASVPSHKFDAWLQASQYERVEFGNGESCARIRYGDESHYKKGIRTPHAKCTDCGCPVGSFHLRIIGRIASEDHICLHERCPKCNDQLACCRCNALGDLDDDDDDEQI